MVQHLHPQLQLPTLCQAAQHQTVGQLWSAARRRYAADRAACLARHSILQQARRALPAAALLPAKRKFSDDAAAQQSSDQPSQHSAISSASELPAAMPRRQHRPLRAVLCAAAAVLTDPSEESGDAANSRQTAAALPDDLQTLPQALAAAASLRPWEQRCLVQHLAAALPQLALACHPGALLGCLALLDAAGAAADGARALLAVAPQLLVAEALSSRTAGSGGDPSGDCPSAIDESTLQPQ